MLFKSSVFLMIFYLVVLLIIESGVLKSPAIIVESYFSTFSSARFGFTCFVVVSCIYTYNCHVFLIDQIFYHYQMSFFVCSDNFVLMSILPYISKALQLFLGTVFMICLLKSFYF